MRDTSRRKLRRVVAVALLLVGFLAGWRGFVLLTPPSEHQTVRLADGSVVELLGYSFGTKHELRVRPPVTGLRDLIGLLHPAPVIRAADTDRAALLLWVRIPHTLELHHGYEPPYIATAKGANGYSFPSNAAEHLDVHYSVGDPYNVSWYGQGTNGAPSMIQEDVVAIPVTCYPHRDARFALDLYQHGGNQKLATFQIANPKLDRSAPFPNATLPATQQDADLKVTLESIRPTNTREVMNPDGSTFLWGGAGTPKTGVLLPGEEGRQRITLSYFYGGKPDPNWKISELEAFDATGNRTHEMAYTPDSPCLNFFPPSTGEPYKLKLGVQKTWNNHFDADELWTIKDIPLPIQGKPIAVHAEFRRDDLHLQLVSVYGMDSKNFKPDVAVVQIKVEAPIANPVLLVHAEDEQGRSVMGPWTELNAMYPPGCTYVENGNILNAHNYWNSDGDTQHRSVLLKIPKGVKHLKLMFKLPRTHFFEFTAPAYQHSPE